MEESEIRMIFSEIKKILSNKFFYIGLTILLIINATVFVSFCRGGDQNVNSYTPKEYRKVLKDLEGMKGTELEYLEGKLNALYTENHINEIWLIEDIVRNYRTCSNYLELVTERINSLKNTNTIGITDFMDDYQKKNFEKKIARSEELLKVHVEAGPSKGIEKVIGYRIVDFVVLAFLLLIVIIIFTSERDNRMLLLYKTTKNGRSEFILSKIAVCMIFAVFATLVFW